jgi:hypothetical protein
LDEPLDDLDDDHAALDALDPPISESGAADVCTNTTHTTIATTTTAAARAAIVVLAFLVRTTTNPLIVYA